MYLDRLGHTDPFKAVKNMPKKIVNVEIKAEMNNRV